MKKGMKVTELFRKTFILACHLSDDLFRCIRTCNGTMGFCLCRSSTWVIKTIGDLAYPCMFAIAMGISRVIFGKYGEQIDLMKFMASSGILCVICYLLTALSLNPILGLIGCIVCGFSVGIMWPGTISISSKEFPMGGTAMFALLAMAGDLGGSTPGIVGHITPECW